MSPYRSLLLAAAGVLVACTPALDWREVRPEGSAVRLLFPCKPDSQTRTLSLAGAPVRLALHACNTGGATWALAVADLHDPARVGPALAELRLSAQRNLAAAEGRPLAHKVPGATPHPDSGRLQFEGRMPDGRAVREQVAVFAKGTQVFQAVALGASLDAEATHTFFDSIRFPP